MLHNTMDLLKNTFEKAALENQWADPESLSGPGSNLEQTQVIRTEIPRLLEKYGIKKMLDAPCGDFFWMKQIRQNLAGVLDSYVGGDIVSQLVNKNNELYADERFSFKVIDITRDQLPAVELIFTRDCFLHLSYRNIYKALSNYKKSGAAFLLVSTYTKARPNYDVNHADISGRALNLEKHPFNFPPPLALINEGCTESNGEYNDKSLGLWRLKDINLVHLRLHLFFKFFRHAVKRLLKKAGF